MFQCKRLRRRTEAEASVDYPANSGATLTIRALRPRNHESTFARRFSINCACLRMAATTWLPFLEGRKGPGYILWSTPICLQAQEALFY